MKIPYENSAERESIITEQTIAGLALVEDQTLTEGSFLIFATTEELATRESDGAKRQLKDRDKSGEDMRVLEDLIDLLIAKGTFTENDLPQAAQDKLSERRDLRAKL